MKVTWLGQSGYIFEHNRKRLIVDPFLSDIIYEKQGIKRLFASPFSVDELKPDYVFITHDHLDHFDPITLYQIHQKFPKCLIAGPESVVFHAEILKINRSVIIPMPKFSEQVFGEFHLHTCPAYHSDPFAVGILLKVSGMTTYISGDTLYSENLAEDIKSISGGPIDLAFVVINGKLGNMNVDKAVTLMRELNPGLAIPMHYGMFEENTEDPVYFTDGCRDNKVESRELVVGMEENLAPLKSSSSEKIR